MIVLKSLLRSISRMKMNSIRTSETDTKLRSKISKYLSVNRKNKKFVNTYAIKALFPRIGVKIIGNHLLQIYVSVNIFLRTYHLILFK